MAALFQVPSARAEEKVLRAVLHADMRVLDPIWTTATVASIHGALVYDTLFGNDAKGDAKPQMVDKYDISADRLTYTFTLRDGLKFHDGTPVTSKDVIPSLKRWAARDGVGQRLFGFVEKLDAVDAKTFRMVLNKPYGMVLESLGKTATSIAVIMREADALTDPQTQVKTAIGSGPFKFAADLWVPGSKAVYLKNADYVPRPGNEPPSFFAGSKFAGVDRLEMVWISDPTLTIDADPSASGNQGLSKAYPAGTAICRVDVTTYSIDTTKKTLQADLNQGGSAIAIADGISEMSITVNSAGIDPEYAITLTGQSSKKDPTNNALVQATLSGKTSPLK